MVSCVQPQAKFTGYADILHKQDSILELFGKYQLSPDGTDSIWKKTYYGVDAEYALDLIKKKKPLDPAWNELMWKAQKYDSIALPTMKEIKRSVKYSETIMKVLDYVSY